MDSSDEQVALNERAPRFDASIIDQIIGSDWDCRQGERWFVRAMRWLNDVDCGDFDRDDDDLILSPADVRFVAEGALHAACRRYNPARGNFKQFACVVVTNAIKRELHRHGLPRDFFANGCVSLQIDPFKERGNEATRPMIAWALRQLPKRERRSVYFRFCLDHEPARGELDRDGLRRWRFVAERLGCEVYAAKMAGNRGLARLRRPVE